MKNLILFFIFCSCIQVCNIKKHLKNATFFLLMSVDSLILQKHPLNFFLAHAPGLPMTRQIKETLKFSQRSKVIQLHEKLWHFMLFILLPCYFVLDSILVLLPKKLSLPMKERIYILNWTKKKEKTATKIEIKFFIYQKYFFTIYRSNNNTLFL